VILKNLPDENDTHLPNLKIFAILLLNTLSWKLLAQIFFAVLSKLKLLTALLSKEKCKDLSTLANYQLQCFLQYVKQITQIADGTLPVPEACFIILYEY